MANWAETFGDFASTLGDVVTGAIPGEVDDQIVDIMLGGGGDGPAPTLPMPWPGGVVPTIPTPGVPSAPGGGFSLPTGVDPVSIVLWLVQQPWAMQVVRQAAERLGILGAGASAHVGTCRAVAVEFRKRFPDAARALALYECGSRIPIGLDNDQSEAVWLALMIRDAGISMDSIADPR